VLFHFVKAPKVNMQYSPVLSPAQDRALGDLQMYMCLG